MRNSPPGTHIIPSGPVTPSPAMIFGLTRAGTESTPHAVKATQVEATAAVAINAIVRLTFSPWLLSEP
jgi:hypothetical protein